MTDLEYVELALKYYGAHLQRIFKFVELVQIGKDIEECSEPNDIF